MGMVYQATAPEVIVAGRPSWSFHFGLTGSLWTNWIHCRVVQLLPSTHTVLIEHQQKNIGAWKNKQTHKHHQRLTFNNSFKQKNLKQRGSKFIHPAFSKKSPWPLKGPLRKDGAPGVARASEAGESLRSRRQGHASRGEGTGRRHWHRALASREHMVLLIVDEYFMFMMLVLTIIDGHWWLMINNHGVIENWWITHVYDVSLHYNWWLMIRYD